MKDLLDGVERELGPSLRIKTRAALDAFRTRLNKARAAPSRKLFEKKLEAFLESEPFLQGAAKKYLRKKTLPALEAAVAALKRAQRFLTKGRTKKRR